MRKVIGLVVLMVVMYGCKKDSGQGNSPLTGYLTQSKLRYVRFSNSGTKEEEYKEQLFGRFSSNTGFVEVGSIYCNDSVLERNGADPTYTKKINNPNASTGWSGWLESSKTWKVTGNPSVGMPAFTETSPAVFSSIISTNFDTLPIIDRSKSYTVNWNTTVLSDFISVQIQDSKSRYITSGLIPGTKTSFTFNASELAYFDSSQIITTGPEKTKDFLIITGVMSKKTTVGSNAVSLENVGSIISTVVLK